MERRVIPTHRDCAARLVPTGDPITIPGGTFVTLTQDLGGNYTVIVNGNMARVDGADADALGFPRTVLEFEARTDGRVDEEQVHEALSSVFDPEIPVNIVDLGLIYATSIGAGGEVDVTMTLTAPGCGMGPVLVHDVERRVSQVPNVSSVTVDLVFEPPWSRDMMSEEAQLELGLF
ncbi:MAG: putative Fe-S cluster assembly protein SufT [Pseudomonadales bacterium]|jgi:probable FeS assembly SUF system protein SufT|nr:putative Fe-S cluster assembly protein SufT [Pseudomonadales bacterium]MDP6472862.1 putative Fe-S cluster assembly protein SufT [Pseudomonadales bacterium]MDP6826382.1 putative Fe-S cluster assembly protein SufT [Pseudomonadales bacterium]MDP6972518.1 putative Fe-S cluster assembly protein SufT [Pseudomonadales bacterium]|tara:strand:+ start:1632 stop:2159 length:528 start_codon:yes stop_codon:yes gene_type:complete